MATAVDGKYGIITAEKKQFHEGEPVFLIRATDPLAPQAIRNYAHGCQINGCSQEHVSACLLHAHNIEAWQLAHPDLVKTLPD